MKINDGGSAFPHEGFDNGPGNIRGRPCEGLTIRDYFAARAMHAMLNNDIRREEMATCANVAKDAYRMADAMLSARESNDPKVTP